MHGGFGIHYELRDVATGRLIAEYNPLYDQDNRPLPDRDIPKWVAELNAREEGGLTSRCSLQAATR